ncbi:hypothetical protein [Amycolatopsis sp. FDAARGOS 1241]|nr:hypothetical protein [Amycolatopsis sp. FDAARGOS 1241]QRP50083.1 hypothetical protein I6J71_21610 [Amycolatopsis sp. FDAARGOS 1241]
MTSSEPDPRPDTTLDRELSGAAELTPDEQRELAEREAASDREGSRERG